MAVFRVRPTGYAYPTGLTYAGDETGNVISSFVALDTWECPVGVTSVEYLVVAGGGAGGGDFRGGGGGAGGFRTGTGHPVTPGTPYTITVGAGGAGAMALKVQMELIQFLTHLLQLVVAQEVGSIWALQHLALPLLETLEDQVGDRQEVKLHQLQQVVVEHQDKVLLVTVAGWATSVAAAEVVLVKPGS